MKSQTNEALETIDLEGLLDDEGLSYRVTWGRSGRQLNLKCCPFCGNSKHKVYLNSETGLGNCFAGSCDQGTFNKWQLLQAIFDLNPKGLHTKIKHLAMQQGWRPKRIVKRPDPGKLNMPRNIRVGDLYALPKYLMDRGITRKVADYFDLRWCESGIFEVDTPDGPIKQDYANRVLIPIYDLQGNLVSFQGRDATGTSEKRYLFPPMYASTGSHLYNINNWDAQDTILICEGPFDVIGAKKAIDHAKLDNILPVGSFGMTFSVNPSGEDQLNKLLALKEKGLKRVVFLWDNETVAIQRAIASALVINRYGFETAVAKLDESKDPGEAPVEEIVKAIQDAHPVKDKLAALMLVKKLTQ